jgi:hypothetical protein
MTAHREDSACTGAVVRNPPVKERAGDEAPTLMRALWRFDRGVEGGRGGREGGGQVMPGAWFLFAIKIKQLYYSMPARTAFSDATQKILRDRHL